jgi:hypothetical protein
MNKSCKQCDKHCKQCGKQMNPVEAIMGPVCGKCCRENHAAFVGKSINKKGDKK